MHRTVHRLSCYMNIPKYSKLFIQIVRETSCTGNNRRVRARSCPGNVFPGNVLSGKVIVRETSVTRPNHLKFNQVVIHPWSTCPQISYKKITRNFFTYLAHKQSDCQSVCEQDNWKSDGTFGGHAPVSEDLDLPWCPIMYFTYCLITLSKWLIDK